VALAWSAVFGSALFGQKDIFHVKSDLVVVYATVLNHDNQFMTGLDKNDFRLRIDGEDTSIEAFWMEDEPISEVVVLDASGSMRSALRSGKLALSSLFRFAHPDDEYAVVLCKELVELAVPFTTQTEPILHWTAPLNAQGSTPLFDAVDRAVQLVRSGQHRRRVVVVITDGEDTSSRLNRLELKNRIVEADVHLYVLQLWAGSASEERFALQEATEATGGLFFKDVLRKRFNGILAQMDVHQQYLIAFRPKSYAGKKKFHRIQLNVSTPAGGPQLHAYYRSSYNAVN